MASGRVDLYISKLPSNTVVITFNCFEVSTELLAIPRNKTITMQRGTTKIPVTVQFIEGRECFADFMEMNFVMSRKLQLQALRRYLLNYNPLTQTLQIQPSPVTETSALVFSQSMLGISIGYELATRLGIPERRGMLIKVRNGKYLAIMRLHVPVNLSDDRLRMPSGWVQRWKMRINSPYRIQYDQRNSTLTLQPAIPITTSRV